MLKFDAFAPYNLLIATLAPHNGRRARPALQPSCFVSLVRTPQQGTFARGSQRPRSYDALLSLHGHDNFVSLGEGGNERIAEQHDYCVFGTQEADRDSDYCASCGNGKTCKASIHVFRGGGGTKRFVVQRTHAPHLDLHALMPSMIA